MKIFLTILIFGYCFMESESILLAIKAKALGYKLGKAAGIAAGLKKGALIGGIGGYGLGQAGSSFGSGRVIRIYTNPIYSYDPRPILPYGHGGIGGFGYGGAGYGGGGFGYGGGGFGYGGGPVVKVLHKHLPQPPKIVNVYHHGGGTFGSGFGSGGGFGASGGFGTSGIGDVGLGGGNGGVQVLKILHEEGDHHHDVNLPAENQVNVVKIIKEDSHGAESVGHGWS